MAEQKPYVPNIGLNAFPVVLPPTVSPSALLAGNGSPEGVVPGIPGQQYVDLVTLDQYTKMGGVQMLGWLKTGKLASYMQIVAAAS